MYFRIFSTIQEGSTKDFNSSNFRSRHPLEQTLRRRVGAREGIGQAHPKGLLCWGAGVGYRRLVLPVVITGREVPDVFLDEEVGLGQEQRRAVITSDSFQLNNTLLNMCLM